MRELCRPRFGPRPAHNVGFICPWLLLAWGLSVAPLAFAVPHNASSFTGPLTVSLVSHGHSAFLPDLLQQLARTGAGLIARVVLTHNLPAAALPDPVTSPAKPWPFQLTQLHNAVPQGFGANHNQAFALADTPLFCVLNPDVALPDPRLWTALCDAARAPGVGCAYPVLLNADGSRQDNARALPTPWALLRRRVLGRHEQQIDWASAALWVLPTAAFARLGGFDERYFMYCEDVDLCLRLQLQGLRLAGVDAQALHYAQRDSHRQWQHLRWHLRSLWRLWRSPSYRAYRSLRGPL